MCIDRLGKGISSFVSVVKETKWKVFLSRDMANIFDNLYTSEFSFYPKKIENRIAAHTHTRENTSASGTPILSFFDLRIMYRISAKPGLRRIPIAPEVRSQNILDERNRAQERKNINLLRSG